MPSVADHLIESLINAGVEHVMGLPGDYSLNFYDKLHKSKIQVVDCTDEAQLGFAADGYARLKGIGCVCTTYNVGTLKLVNAIAGAHEERSPVIVISGAPGMSERTEEVRLHHMVRSFTNQETIYKQITCASVVLDNPVEAGYKIDYVLERLKYCKQPIYIELPRDIAEKSIGYDIHTQGTPRPPQSDEQSLEEAYNEVLNWLNTAENPVILAGVELARYGLGKPLVKFAERFNIPMATTLLSKSVIGEDHPLFLGVYAGNGSDPSIQKAVESSDCLLMFGVMLTDVTLSFMPSKFERRKTVFASVESLKVKSHKYKTVLFEDFCNKVFNTPEANFPKLSGKMPEVVKNKPTKFEPKDAKITNARLFEKINSVLTENTTIISDVGDSLFGALDMYVRNSNHFLASAHYTSMGFAIPAALGACLAEPTSRPIVLVGDGAFQMSCSELSTILELNLNPIIVVFNNKGYSTERLLMDGPYNDIREWAYHDITKLLNGGIGFKVENEVELQEAFNKAIEAKELSIINVVLEPDDISTALARISTSLKKRTK